MPAPKNIAIVGSSGQIGTPITRALLSNGHSTITALTRPDSTSILPTGIHFTKQASYTDHPSLVAALKDQDILIISLAVTAPPETQHSLIDAAAEAGVKYVILNEWGMDPSAKSLGEDVFLGPKLLATRKYVEEVSKGKMGWLAVSCGFWYEFSLAGTEARYGFDFGKKALTLFDNGDTQICTSTWSFVGDAVASLLSLPFSAPAATPSAATPCLEDYRNKGINIASFHLSQLDMLASVLRVTNTIEAEWTITHEPSKERYERGVKMFQRGELEGFGILLYTRAFYPSDPADFSGGLDQERLGLGVLGSEGEEGLDAATARAVEMAQTEGKFSGRV